MVVEYQEIEGKRFWRTKAGGGKAKLKFYDWSDEKAYLDPLVEVQCTE